jgi:hypothetical protein
LLGIPRSSTIQYRLVHLHHQKAIAAYGSPAYREALKALGDGAVRDIRIVEGLD